MQDDQGDDIAATALHAGDGASAVPAFYDVKDGGQVWVVIGTNGENMIRAEGATRLEANVQSVIVRTTAVVMPPPPQSFLAEPVADLGKMAEDVTVQCDAYAPDRLVTDRDGSGRRWPPQYGPAPGPGPAVSR